ncbi:E3 ubiquitin-protein ligase rad18 [Cadophora gregata]|uniref:E3 ubiquitin-protein ligase rad18 n=1 Tax=Cadophora gregata TaxID=51156 RepID=UPI0026DC34E1|nr:E3 ubiquitin-protein ligase rad18 [Cadophora gregata]KAK0119582.1 E3 ubiquitin-protein ligase rad18 [Cadophora gregata]KAK0120618.1 E3 ubiquitin-protein ligase rad18 [Cadophora gregata f. sp. sojae]
MNKVSKDDAFEITDSTDWLETPLRALAGVDSALRCQVCKDFYTTPMITSCSHTFCSLCIRRCLNNDGKCPACRTQDQELKLRFNGAMQDLVEAFIKARPEVLEHARRPLEVPGSPSSKRDRKEAELDDEDAPRKRTRSAGTRTSSRRLQPTPQQVIEDSDDDDEDFVPEYGYVRCPVCSKQVKEAIINSHLDRDCADEPRITKPKAMGRISNKESAQNTLTIYDAPKRPERLAQINFSMMKEAALRKKLGEMGISAAGNKPLMERRYTEWITLWNANCDARKPRTKAELKRELEIWERTQGGRAQTSTYGQSSGQVKDKDFDGKAYSSTHDDSFRKLIANARKKAAVKPPTSEASNSPRISKEDDETRANREGLHDQMPPVNQSGLQRRSSEESGRFVKSPPKPPSQFVNNLMIVDKESSSPPDLPAVGTVQP